MLGQQSLWWHAQSAAVLIVYVDDVLMSVIGRARERGELRTDRTTEELVQLFAAVVNGLLMERWFPGGTLALDDIARLAVDQYLHGASA